MNIKEGFKFGGTAERSTTRRSGEAGAVGRAVDLGTVALGFLFGGCHAFLSAYPFGIALVAALDTRVQYALLGAVVGSLLLGSDGVIFAMVTLLTVLLRLVISGTRQASDVDGERPRRTFGEPLSLKISSAVISGFVSALYEILLYGLSLSGVLYGVVMMTLAALAALVFSFAFRHGVGVKALLFSNERVFYPKDGARGKIELWLFRVGLLGIVFVTSLSFSRFRLFGIDLSYVFSAAVAMLAAKRFGITAGAVTGFVSTVGISGIYSPSFLLAGAVLGALFPFGSLFAVSASCIAVSAWGSYVGGVSGLLSVLPETLIASALMMPVFRYVEKERSPQRQDSAQRRATDMVGTMALSYRGKSEALSTRAARALRGASVTVSRYLDGDDSLPASAVSNILDEACKLDLCERELNEALTDKLEPVLESCGLQGGLIRAFGNTRPHVILAAEDPDGDKISSPRLRRELESAMGVLLSEPEYYRREEMVVMVAGCRKRLTLEGAFATAAASRSDVSGDTVRIFETDSQNAFALISDGMGSGEEAKRASELAAGLFEATLGLGSSVGGIVGILNSTIRRRGEECGASVDLFSLDLVTGTAYFVKSGASPSYIKRGSALYKIRSETLPVGVMRKVDAERITATVEAGDYIIMTSDGAVAEEDSPWLVELLNRKTECSLPEYAALILAEAERNVGTDDDRTVAVLRVSDARG